MEEQNPPEITDGTDGDHVDEEILADLFTLMVGESPDGLIQVFDLFQAGVPSRLDDAETALGERRLEDAGRAAHNLRGTAGAFGARHLSHLCDRLEQACGQGDVATGLALVAEMRAEFVAFRDILTSRLASLTSG